MSARRHSSLCSDDCTYKRLYAGSQASLSDMASKQASALNRVARLRSALIGALKQNFPVEFVTAEAQLGKRISTVDDEILLAYLTGFLTAATRRPVDRPTAGMDELGEELRALGVILPSGTDQRAWAGAVAAWSQQQAAATAPEAPDSAEPEPTASAASAAQTAKAQAGRERKRTGSKALRPPAGTAAFAAPALPHENAGRDSTIEDPTFETGLADFGGAEGDVPWGEDPDPAAFDDFASRFDDAPPVHDHPAGPSAAPAGVDPQPGGLEDLFGDDLSCLFDDELSADAEALVDALFNTDDSAPDAADTAVAAEPATAISPPPAEPAEPPLAGTPSNPPMSDASSASRTDPPAAKAGRAPSDRAGSALRPELFPTTAMPKQAKASRRAKTSRVSAARPDPRGLDVPIIQGGGGGDLTDEIFNQLVASVCIPRPVFTSDLAAQTGSVKLVQAWEQRCHDMGTDSPVRFINPKPRHRERGALVVPHSKELRQATAEFAKSWWATCLDERRLRGARLYEVAVLLHRFGESVISNRIADDIVVLRVTQPRGLVGIAVVLETDFTAGSPARVALADAVGQLLDDRLTLVAVLTHTAGDTIERMSSALREEAQQRGWAPTTPVVASLSWDFATDGGSSALSVL